MYKECKDPKGAEKIQACIDILQEIHDGIISKGCSKREITTVTLTKIIQELKNVKHSMS